MLQKGIVLLLPSSQDEHVDKHVCNCGRCSEVTVDRTYITFDDTLQQCDVSGTAKTNTSTTNSPFTSLHTPSFTTTSSNNSSSSRNDTSVRSTPPDHHCFGCLRRNGQQIIMVDIEAHCRSINEYALWIRIVNTYTCLGEIHDIAVSYGKFVSHVSKQRCTTSRPWLREHTI